MARECINSLIQMLFVYCIAVIKLQHTREDIFPVSKVKVTLPSKRGLKFMTGEHINNSFIWVTAYFQAEGSKHNSGNYVTWVSAFLRNFTAPLFFFTTPDQAKFYSEKVPNNNVHYITKYTNIWQVPCVSNQKEVYKNQRIRQKEPEGREDVYAVWNSKVCLVKEVSDLLPESIVFWIDCGSMRESIYYNMPFPNEDRLLQVFPNRSTGGEMVFAMYEKALVRRERSMSFISQVLVIGGFFAGDHAAIERFYTTFWQIHNKFAMENQSVGIDQYVFSTYLLFFGNSWIQPNYVIRDCDRWFGTFSFYGDLNKCDWGKDTHLYPISEYMYD